MCSGKKHVCTKTQASGLYRLFNSKTNVLPLLGYIRYNVLRMVRNNTQFTSSAPQRPIKSEFNVLNTSEELQAQILINVYA